MKLLTKAIQSSLPPLYSQEANPDPVVRCKFFTPDSNWTWFVTEAEPQEDGDILFFGYVIGHDSEWGYFAYSELSTARGPYGLPIERDLHFKPAPFSEVLARYNRERGRVA